MKPMNSEKRNNFYIRYWIIALLLLILLGMALFERYVMAPPYESIDEQEMYRHIAHYRMDETTDNLHVTRLTPEQLTNKTVPTVRKEQAHRLYGVDRHAYQDWLSDFNQTADPNKSMMRYWIDNDSLRRVQVGPLQQRLTHKSSNEPFTLSTTMLDIWSKWSYDIKKRYQQIIRTDQATEKQVIDHLSEETLDNIVSGSQIEGKATSLQTLNRLNPFRKANRPVDFKTYRERHSTQNENGSIYPSYLKEQVARMYRQGFTYRDTKQKRALYQEQINDTYDPVIRDFIRASHDRRTVHFEVEQGERFGPSETRIVYDTALHGVAGNQTLYMHPDAQLGIGTLQHRIVDIKTGVDAITYLEDEGYTPHYQPLTKNGASDTRFPAQGVIKEWYDSKIYPDQPKPTLSDVAKRLQNEQHLSGTLVTLTVDVRANDNYQTLPSLFKTEDKPYEKPNPEATGGFWIHPNDYSWGVKKEPVSALHPYGDTKLHKAFVPLTFERGATRDHKTYTVGSWLPLGETKRYVFAYMVQPHEWLPGNSTEHDRENYYTKWKQAQKPETIKEEPNARIEQLAPDELRAHHFTAEQLFITTSDYSALDRFSIESVRDTLFGKRMDRQDFKHHLIPAPITTRYVPQGSISPDWFYYRGERENTHTVDTYDESAWYMKEKPSNDKPTLMLNEVTPEYQKE